MKNSEKIAKACSLVGEVKFKYDRPQTAALTERIVREITEAEKLLKDTFSILRSLSD